MLGLETALSIVQKTMIDSGLMDWAQVADRLSTAPARIAGYVEQGRNLEIGARANVMIIDPAAAWTVDRDLMASKSRNTPFHGYELPGVITHTFFNGIPTLMNGALVESGDAR
jgi:dihydroorotase